MMRRGLALLVATLGCLAQAEPVRLATGDYAPLTGEAEPGGGLLSRLVLAAYAAQGASVQLSFLPWQRGHNDTLKGFYEATFPYVKNTQREASFLFSAPIFVDTIRLFGPVEAAKPLAWKGRAICVPLGFNVQHIQAFAKAQGATLEQPATLLNCFQLLQLGRVQGVWASETVAEYVTRGQAAFQYQPLKLGVDYRVEYFLMVPKSASGAAGAVARFNTGLAQIRKSGEYKKILGRLAS